VTAYAAQFGKPAGKEHAAKMNGDFAA